MYHWLLVSDRLWCELAEWRWDSWYACLSVCLYVYLCLCLYVYVYG